MLNTTPYKSLVIAVLVAAGGFGPVDANGDLSVQPAELDFGIVEIGDSAVMTATVSNTADPGAGALTLDALELDGGLVDPSTALVSLRPEGGQWSNYSSRTVITPDSRYVAFNAKDSGNAPRTFRHDLWTGEIEIASANSEGDWVISPEYDGAFDISSDGRYVAFTYSGGGMSTPPIPDGLAGFYMRDMDTGITEFIDIPTTDGEPPDWWHTRMSFSADFRLMVFTSGASNLVPGMTHTDGTSHVYVYDRDADTVELASVASDGTPYGGMYPTISGDGRYVAFLNPFAGLVPDDTNDLWDIFLHDRVTGITERVSVASDGSEGDGNVQVEALPGISADGRYVAFSSFASNLVPDDTNGRPDVFIRDRVAGTTERISAASGGSQSAGASQNPVITPDGRYVVFHSDAPNLVPDDGNDQFDTIIHDRIAGTNERVSVATDGTEGNAHSFGSMPGVSADGRFVTFATNAFNLAPDGNGFVDIYVRDRGGPGSAFAITGGGCGVGTELEAGEICMVEITFSADSPGDFEDALNVETADGQSQVVPLHGTAPQGPVLAFSPSSLDFGDVEVGTASTPHHATLTNTGDGDATGLAFTQPGSGFDADTSDCGSTLPAGQSCQVVVTFTPLAVGSWFAPIDAESAGDATARLTLGGNGAGAPPKPDQLFRDRFEQDDGP